jgi:hypothetical protein
VSLGEFEWTYVELSGYVYVYVYVYVDPDELKLFR